MYLLPALYLILEFGILIIDKSCSVYRCQISNAIVLHLHLTEKVSCQDGMMVKLGHFILNQVYLNTYNLLLGKLMYVINDAHLHGVTSIALTSDSSRVVSGGSEGEVRIFKLGK